MNRAPTMLLWATISLRIATSLACLTILAATAWGLVSHKTIDLPRPLVAAFLLMVIARVLVWLSWRAMRIRNPA